MKIVTVSYLIIIFATSACVAQRNAGFYNKSSTFQQWIQSLKNETDSVQSFNKSLSLENFGLMINYLDSGFYRIMIDTLWKYDRGIADNHYIAINTFMGEQAVTEIIVRAYNKSDGHEVRFFMEPEGRQLTSSSFVPNQNLLDSIYNTMQVKSTPTRHLLILSKYKSGSFETKILSVDDREKAEMVRRLFPYVGNPLK